MSTSNSYLANYFQVIVEGIAINRIISASVQWSRTMMTIISAPSFLQHLQTIGITILEIGELRQGELRQELQVPTRGEEAEIVDYNCFRVYLYKEIEILSALY